MSKPHFAAYNNPRPVFALALSGPACFAGVTQIRDTTRSSEAIRLINCLLKAIKSNSFLKLSDMFIRSFDYNVKIEES